ncbi:MAG: hypothetical protein IJY27_05890 [Clostridia bacterium]|nr:hypothetical protein [Clostridia bacterium]
MKKFLVSLLSLSLLLCALAGCKPLDSFIENQLPAEQVYTCNEFSITLPREFVSDQQSLLGGSSEVFKSSDYTVKVVKYSFSSITPKDGYEFPSLAQFVYDIANFVEDNQLVVLSGDGISSGSVFGYDYANENGGDRQLLVFLESDNAYWFVSFYSATVDYETAKAQYLEWVNTITFG